MRCLRRHWPEIAAVVVTVAVVFGCIGYFVGTQSRGEVYQITGSKANAAYELEETAAPTDTLAATESTEAAAETTEAAEITETVAPSVSPVAESVDSGLVNINTADSEALQTLPGIGPQRAQDILDYRNEHGSFEAKEDLLKISGIGEKTLDKLIDLITVE